MPAQFQCPYALDLLMGDKQHAWLGFERKKQPPEPRQTRDSSPLALLAAPHARGTRPRDAALDDALGPLRRVRP